MFPDYQKNIREGFAATTGFETVTGICVPKKQKVAANCIPYQDWVTYHLDPDPDAYDLEEEQLGHIQWVTLAWREKRESSPFVFDFYLHGDAPTGAANGALPLVGLEMRSSLYPDHLAIRVAGLDIRKFLHQSIVPIFGDSPLARLQAYFEEFSRKAKIIYPLRHQQSNPPTGGSERRPPVGRSGHADIVTRKIIYAKNVDVTNRESNTEVFHPGEQVAQRISDIVLVNNCREPGNYEIKIRDILGRNLLKANFSFSTRHYNDLLTRFHGIGIAQQGTGIGIPWTIRKREWRRYWDSFLPWKWIKRFPRVRLTDLSHLHGNEVSLVRGGIEPVYGRIPFEEYEIDQEVQMKSRPHFLGPEPLTYVRVNPKLSLPIGFEPPRGAIPTGALPDKTEPMAYWMAKENRGKIVPHHFRTFEDIQHHDLFFSEFALNGVYTGKSDLEEDFDWERKEGRWQFDFRYLGRLKRFEMREFSGGYTELRLISETTDKRPIHFALGNFRLNPGEKTEFLFGLGTQPLIADYNQNSAQEPLRYAVAYDANEMILDHHDRGIGIEKVMIERVDETSYKVRLISYERILPVWEGVVRIGS